MTDVRSILGAPLALRSGAGLPNRFAKAAMSESLGDAAGDPTEELVRLYERLGRGGAGLVVTGNVMVAPGGKGEPGNVIWREGAPLERWRAWADASQRHGTPTIVQINHAGRQAPRSLVAHPVAPSAVPVSIPGAFGTPRALEDEEIEVILDGFAGTAKTAVEAGFAGVQLHGAHGYLISQFLSPLTNRRTDRWGGSLAHRMRFVLEAQRRVRAAVGERAIVSVKLNSSDFLHGGFTIEESIEVARALAAEGVDLLEVSGGTYERPAMFVAAKASTAAREAHFLEYASRIRAAIPTPVMLTGGLRSAETMARVVAEGHADVIGLGRPIALEPDLPRAILEGRADRSAIAQAPTGMVGAAMDAAWYKQQLQRMGRGLEPEASASRLCAIWSVAKALVRKPERARLSA
jgi:2,4-dienoyl-CoA reductase-like NADH-dependent reductase (Old Yellow Enzyme family)